jgi:uncharacterized protein YqeY
MKQAMKSGDKDRLGVIRMLRGELKNAQIAAGEDLTEEAEQKVVASYAKKRKESMDQYTEAGRQDLADKENFEYNICLSYLPPRMDEAELEGLIRKAIEETGAQGPKDFGLVMKTVMKAVGSRAEGSAVSGAVKKILKP